MGYIEKNEKRAFIDKRFDDSHDNVVRTWVHIYEKDTKSLVAHYLELLISRFNADQIPLEVLRDILLKLSDLLSYPEKISYPTF